MVTGRVSRPPPDSGRKRWRASVRPGWTCTSGPDGLSFLFSASFAHEKKRDPTAAMAWSELSFFLLVSLFI